MSRNLSDQLHSYGEVLHSKVPAVELSRVHGDSSTDVLGRPGLDHRRPHRRWVYGLVAAVLTLIIIGGAALMLGPPSEEPPVVTTPPTLPPLPTLSTTVITGEADTIPFGDMVSVGDGFVAVEWLYAGDPGLWRSDDGSRWTREALPVGGGLVDSIEHNAWGYWLMDPYGPSDHVWWSEDSITWRRVDLGPVPLPDMTSAGWGVRTGGIAVKDDAVVVRLTVFWNLSIPLRDALGLQGLAPEWNPETGIIEMRDHEQGESAGPVEARVRLTAQVERDLVSVQAVNADTGAALGAFSGRISGVSTGQLMAGLATGEVTFDVLAVSSDTESFDLITVPWEGRAQILSRDGSFLAYSMPGPYPLDEDDVIEAWSSSDGRSWHLVGTPSFPEGTVTSLSIGERDGTLLAMVRQGEASPMLLMSSDGLDWAPVQLAPSAGEVDGAAIFQTDLGWLHTRTVYGPAYSSTGNTDFELWFSPDGERWRQLDVSSLGIRTATSNGGSFGTFAVGNRLFVVLSDDAAVPARIMWIIELEPAS